MTELARVLVISAALAACSSPSTAVPEARLTQKQFVDVMVELELRPDQRTNIFEKHRTNVKDLRDFVTAYAESPALLGVTFDSIQVRVDRGTVPLP